MKKKNKSLLVLFSLALISLSFLGFCLAESSTSVYKVQYTNPFGGSYENLMNGPSSTSSGSGSDEGLYEVAFTIPPLGCSPAVVRSDLLEEQDVPVFCQLVPLKMTAGLSINQIDSINVVKKEDNPYVSGVGFYPAKAAIASGRGVSNVASMDNIGYVVVVLKKIPAEKDMPSGVNITLAASLNMRASGGNGFGESDFYLPEMSESDFENSYLDSSFNNGMAYLRAENIDDSSAVISLYSSNGASSSNFQRLFSSRIEKGKASGDIYISNFGYNQGVRITLDSITLAETKAKIRVNGQEFDVYKNGKFYNGKCSLNNIESYGAGAGTVSVSCEGGSLKLSRTYNNLEIFVEGIRMDYASLGQQINSLSDANNNVYIGYVGGYSEGNNIKSYVIASQISSKSNIKVAEITKYLDSKIKPLGSKADETKIKAVVDSYNADKNNINVKLYYVSEGLDGTNIILGKDKAGQEITKKLTFNGVGLSNLALGDAEAPFNNALNSYDLVKSSFGSENYLKTSYSYGERALWSSYKLAIYMGQMTKANEILSRIANDYPDSIDPDSKKTANLLMNTKQLLGDEGSSGYIEKSNLFVELVSVTQPSASESGVDASCSIDGNSFSNPSAAIGDNICRSGDGKKIVNITSFTEDRVRVGCSVVNEQGKTLPSTFADIAVGKTGYVQACSANIFINKVNQKKVAHVRIVPITQGNTRESNFTFAIGIEKRAIAMNLTPEQANKKIDELNKQIESYRNITEALGKIIKADKLACLATTTVINFKNLFAGINGEATARTAVMEKWNSLCESSTFQQQSLATDQESCISKNYEAIEKDVEAAKTYQGEYNNLETALRTSAKDPKTGVVDETLVKSGIIDKINEKVTGTIKGTNGDYTKDQISKIISKDQVSSIDYAQLSSLYYQIQMAENPNLDVNARNSYAASAASIISQIESREKTQAELISSQGNGLDSARVGVFKAGQQVTALGYKGTKFSDINGLLTIPSEIKIELGEPIAVYGNYLFVLYDSTTDTIGVKDIYSISSDKKLASLDDKTKLELRDKYHFVKMDTKFNNVCKNCDTMKVFVLEPYKGMPALLPFDKQNGWYVQVKQNFAGLGTGEQKSYQDSGKLNSFWICNVGSDGLMDGVGIDKDCARFDFYTSSLLDTNILGLSDQQSRDLLRRAVSAVESAQKQLAANPGATTINVGDIRGLKVKNSEGDSGSKCTDFMSSRDCKIIFNVCDPVICPTSRCDFGGKFKVDNVIQSGIIGSTLLCAPNFVGFGGDVVVPVCLTGISAGIEGWTSIMENYRDCINESVTTGKTTGICDELNSVYMCDFFWRQAGPLANALVKNAFLMFFGKKDRGGGEYAFVQDAWNNVEKSAQYFQNNYGSNSKLAFGVKDLSNAVVAEVCKSPMSATYPSGFDSMLEPESPVQFNAFYQELPYTDATVPARSQYKVFYHIYGGNDGNGHYYQIYLKNAPETSGYVTKDSTVVASGFVGKGEYASETKDFLDVAGYKELCVRIDAQDKCGFKSVSTSAALNYAKDMAAKSQATSGVTTESGCVNGDHNVGSFLTPNIQQGVEEFTNPELYNQGIIRVCSGTNPGNNVEPDRWQDTGYCDNAAIRCWIDTRSVKKAIVGAGLENETLSEIQKTSMQNLANQGGYLQGTAASEKIADLDNAYGTIVSAATYTGLVTSTLLDINGKSFSGRSLTNLEEDVKTLNDHLIMSSDRANLEYVKAQIYDDVARKLKNSGISISATPAAPVAAPAGGNTIDSGVDSPQVYLAKMIYGEERSEGETAMTAAGWVAINRLVSPGFPKTLPEVITQANQFQGYAAVASIPLTSLDSSSWQQSLSIANSIWNSYTSGGNVNAIYESYLYFVNVESNKGNNFVINCRDQKKYGSDFKQTVIKGKTKDLVLTNKYCGDVSLTSSPATPDPAAVIEKYVFAITEYFYIWQYTPEDTLHQMVNLVGESSGTEKTSAPIFRIGNRIFDGHYNIYIGKDTIIGNVADRIIHLDFNAIDSSGMSGEEFEQQKLYMHILDGKNYYDLDGKNIYEDGTFVKGKSIG